MDVPVLAIDTFVEQENIGPVSFIKIDVQGYEPAVCAGMERTLARNPGCVVSLEYMPEALHEQGYEPSRLVESFEERGYRTYTILKGGKLQAGAPKDLPDHGWADVLFAKGAALV